MNVTPPKKFGSPPVPRSLGRGLILKTLLDRNANILDQSRLPGFDTRQHVEMDTTFDSLYELPQDPDTCSHCQRPPKVIVCRACGHTFEGRIRKKCPHHPEIIHLMDTSACPGCKAVQLMECT